MLHVHHRGSSRAGLACMTDSHGAGLWGDWVQAFPRTDTLGVAARHLGLEAAGHHIGARIENQPCSTGRPPQSPEQVDTGWSALLQQVIHQQGTSGEAWRCYPEDHRGRTLGCKSQRQRCPGHYTRQQAGRQNGAMSVAILRKVPLLGAHPTGTCKSLKTILRAAWIGQSMAQAGGEG
jgi:hypothetical protein